MNTKASPAVEDGNYSGDSIAQIREIILGEYIRNSEKNLKKLKSAIEQLSRDVNVRLDRLEQSISHVQKEGEVSKEVLQQELQKQRQSIEKDLKDTRDRIKNELQNLQESKVDKSAIGEVFIQWGQQVIKNK